MKGPRVRELNAGADPTIPGFGFTSVAFGSALLTLLRFSDITEVYPQGWYGCASCNGRTVPKVVRMRPNQCQNRTKKQGVRFGAWELNPAD